MQKAVENSGTTMAAVLSSELDKTVNSVSELNVQGIEINISNYNDCLNKGNLATDAPLPLM